MLGGEAVAFEARIAVIFPIVAGCIFDCNAASCRVERNVAYKYVAYKYHNCHMLGISYVCRRLEN